MSGLTRLARVALSRPLVLEKSNVARFISTSQGKRDVTAVGNVRTEPGPVTAKDFAEAHLKNKNWVTYGFDEHDRQNDENVMHTTFFLFISCICVGGVFFWSYRPDFALRDWAQREAFIELRRREAAGLPLVDPNYVDPATVRLPTEEELVGVEIIV